MYERLWAARNKGRTVLQKDFQADLAAAALHQQSPR